MNNITNLIDNISNDINNFIKFETASNSFKHASSYIPTQSNVPAQVVHHTHNYTDNSWNTYNTSKTIICNNDQSNNGGTKKDGEGKEKEDTSGNSPITFLIGAGLLAVGTTYLIATDDYTVISKKFNKLDDKINQLVDKTKNTVHEEIVTTFKTDYENFKSKMLDTKLQNYYTKWGLIGSGLVGMTYFFPFGTIALVPSLVGLTGFTCYWLWNYLTKDEKDDIMSEYETLKNKTNELKNKIYLFSQNPFESQNMCDSMYQKYTTHNEQHAYPGAYTQQPSAPVYPII